MTSSVSHMQGVRQYRMYKYALTSLFIIITGSLFVYLNQVQPHFFIDEIFHIPQTIQYCDGNLFMWDPKITTLPGLYIITMLILAPVNLCSTTYIRSINLFATFMNLYLTYRIIKHIRKNMWDDWTQLGVAYTIAIFPPLFFWFFLYYTDVLSVSMVLLMLLFHVQKHFKMAAVSGLLAILIRQTNIIWVAFLTMERILDLINYKERKVESNGFSTIYRLKLLYSNIIYEIHYRPILFIKSLFQIGREIYPYVTVGVIFLIFIIWNKGIVVGDRTAHVPTIHIPQIFYFSIFVFCFLWPYMISNWRAYLFFIKKHWFLSSSIFACMVIIVHSNTLVHPYMLADNRHYTFYVWNKFMNRYVFFKYLLIPVYCFSIYSILKSIDHLRLITLLAYVVCVSAVLIPQLLVEPRYFIMPYIIYRLNIQKPRPWQLFAELSTSIVINFLQFFIFINKVIYWKDQDHPQRIAW